MANDTRFSETENTSRKIPDLCVKKAPHTLYDIAEVLGRAPLDTRTTRAN